MNLGELVNKIEKIQCLRDWQKRGASRRVQKGNSILCFNGLTTEETKELADLENLQVQSYSLLEEIKEKWPHAGHQPELRAKVWDELAEYEQTK